MTAIETTSALHTLRRSFKGVVIEPGRNGWTSSTQAFNLSFTQEPELVAVPADERDVITIVDFARAHGLQVAPQRTGHNAEPLGAMDGVILVKTDALRGVEIDAQRSIARVGGGAVWGDVVPRASDLGLAALHGSSPGVGIAGYSLGGGVGWYARKLGLAANSITAIELVTALGELRRVDHDNDSELFWALRGGGGNFGIVTALEFRLFSVPEVYAGVLFFPWERSAEVLHAWNGWTAGAPDEVTSVGRILQFPPLPQLPEPLRGRQFVAVEAVFMGDEASGVDLLRPLRELGPAIDTFAMVPPAGIAELHMDPPEPMPFTGDGRMIGFLPDVAIDAFVEVAGPGSGSPLVSAEIRHLGGALLRPADDHGALATFDAQYLTYAVGVVLDDETHAANRAQLDTLAAALEPYEAGRQYLNFVAEQTDPARFYRPGAYRRLQAAKAAVDPENVFRANHPIPADG